MGRTVLVVAHPGHELRIHAWVAAVRPVVLILTDGSGNTGKPRIDSSRRLLDSLGAAPGRIFGVLSDREVYAALMRGDLKTFTNLAVQVSTELVEADAQLVVADEAEGYNPAHDVCRLVVNAAVGMFRRSGAGIQSLEFPLVGPPRRKKGGEPAVSIGLSSEEWDRKMKDAFAYEELAFEVEEVRRTIGLPSLRREILYPAMEGPLDGLEPDAKPYYEMFGEKRVSEGVYKTVLRRSQHVLPVARALDKL